MPVFLFVADLSKREMYVNAIDEQIRRDYGKLATQKTISFKLISGMQLGTPACEVLMHVFYKRERFYSQASVYIANLINQMATFIDFIAENQHRDIFMEVEVEQHVQFRALHDTCRICAAYIHMDWPIPTLEELYAMDDNEWKDKSVYLHEKTHDYALVRIEPRFPALIRGVVQLVTETEADYWRERDPILVELCASGAIFWGLRQLEARLERRSKTT